RVSRSLSALIESIDGIRTMLLCDNALPARQVFMITSARSREGQTTLASRLASSIARCGRRTLLIDGDMRRPALHRLFEVAGQPGLVDVLCGDVDVADAVVAVPGTSLWVLPAGENARPAL